MVTNQMDMCVAKGIQKIKCFAAQGSGYVGFKVWYKMGYDGMISLDQVRGRGQQQFPLWVLKSVERKIYEYPEDMLYSMMEEVLQKCVALKKTAYFRSLPQAFEDRYLDIRFGEGDERNQGWGDLVPTLERVDIYQFAQYMTENYFMALDFAFAKVNPFEGTDLDIAQDSIQNLMDVEGFESWWASNGAGWNGTMDLSEGTDSEAYMILDLYRKKKGLGKMASEALLTKAMGYLSPEEIALFDEARKEIRSLRKSTVRIAHQWLA
jgi:hypothetical protein